ncbi:MAG: sulfatase-like hydrolase/transferase, partial [Acidobacteriota bacterium]
MTHPPSQTGALPSRALASSATISGLVFATLAVLELLLQASGRDLISLPVWGTLLLGHGLLAASVAVGGVVLAGGLDVARRLGLPLPANISAADGTAALATLVVGFIHGWPLVKEAWSPWLGRPLALVLLALGLLGVCLLLRGVASAGELAVPLACAAAALLGFYLLRAEPLGLKPAPLVVALGILVATLVALGWITTRGGRLRSVQLLAVALGLVLVVRLAAPAPHGWIEQAVGDPAPRSARGAAASTPVFLVVLDTLRADAVDLDAASQSGAQSSTPSLARLASHSDVFHRAIANGSWTLPTHASMFTGLQVSEHRLDMTSARGFGPRLAADIPTLHEHLAARGYATSCITANGVVSPATGLTRGCQRYRNPNRVWMLQTAPLRLWYALSPSPRPALEEQLTTQLLGLRRTASAGEVIRLALQELERQELDAAESLSESGAPYLFLNFMDVHKPYSPSASSDPAQRRAFFGDL